MRDPCKAASLRAYRELRALGRPAAVAFEAAVRVYRYHHPSARSPECQGIVADWIEEGGVERRFAVPHAIH